MQEAVMLSDPRPRVLCVDDDEDSRVMLTTLLRVAPIEAKAVGTAAQALSLIQTERFDLYLLDSRLPDLNGFELCRRMRAFDLHTPILSSFPELPMVSQQRPGSPWSNDGYGDYGGSYELRQKALNAGYNEGVREGSNDPQNRSRFDYRGAKPHQKATQHYHSRLAAPPIHPPSIPASLA